jgi:type II secretory pathway pseudopilin PulG
MQRLAPDLAGTLTQSQKSAEGAMFCLYGEESAISEASNSSSLDVGGILVVAAIAIPNLLKSKIAANEATAVGGLRTLTVAEITYASTYPNKGYSPNLASLGPGTNGSKAESPEHANLVDASLAGPTCKGDTWCTKSGYQFRVSAVCKEGNCSRFIAVAKPEGSSTGTRNFCVTDDGVIHYKMGEPLDTRLTIAECRKWEALH